MTGAHASRRPLVLATILLSFAAAFAKTGLHPAPPGFRVTSPPEQAAPSPPRFRTRFVSLRNNIQTHAPCLVELTDGRVRAFWYAGSREGAEDVEVMTAVFDPARDGWGGERAVVGSGSTERALWRFVRKVGNPIAGHGADGRLWLFYVTVSVGGWAGSSITAMVSTDEGETWGPPRRLVTSPFLNLSTLVRGSPFLYADGTMGLPVYQEFIGRLGELLRLSPSGELVDKERLGPSGSGLQPVVLVESATDALVLMRRSGWERVHRVLQTRTRDGGHSWSPPSVSPLPNPDSALSGLVLPDGALLVALNDIEEGRDALSLVLSPDGGRSWKTVARLEDESPARGRPQDEAVYLERIEALARASDRALENPALYAPSVKHAMYWDLQYHFEFSYPHLIHARGGDFHLVYDWNRTFIKHVQFNSAWLERALAAPSHASLH